MQKFQTRLKELWEKIKGFFKKLNKKTRILLGVCLAAVLVIAIAAAVLLNKKEYAILCTDLSSSEMTTMAQFLSENGVTDYQIKNDSILVPAGREVQLQAQLALSGNLNDAFLYPYYTENIGMTSTTAEQERAWLVSVQDRLAAIIKQFDGVREAWVTITPGTERLYVLDPNTTPSSASVTIELSGNQPLSDNVVTAIRDTVSHSVERLNIENVSLHDTSGNPYSDTSLIAQANEATALKIQHEEQINSNVRSQVLQTLESIYGPGNVQVGVISTVEVARKIVDKTYYDQPDGSVVGGGLVINDTLFWEVIRDGSEPVGGTVGTATNSNLPIYPDLDTALDENSQYVGEQLDRNQVVNITTEQMEVLEGRLTDLRVTVMVNADSVNGNVMTVDELKDSVATLSGIGAESVEAAQNRVFVSIKPFYTEPTTEPGGPGGIFLQNSWVLYAAIGGLVLFLVLLLIIILLARRSKKKKLAQQMALEEEMAAAEAAAEAAAILAAVPPTGGADIMEINTEKSMELRKNVRQFAQNNPEIAAQMVRSWLKGDETGG